ncbi:hypothetical protein [Buttiauxella gaviniae]|uniref:hypothetical protein n=1 Tax=Buttiauxella gaviniae TaxID=82990 RepID=UPI003C78A364
MDVVRIVDDYLYKKCCEKNRLGVDVLPSTLINELLAQNPSLSKSEIITALESIKEAKLQYREYSDGNKEISLICYETHFN